MLLTFVKLVGIIPRLADCYLEGTGHSSSDVSDRSVEILPISGIRPLGTTSLGLVWSGLVRNMRPLMLLSTGSRFGGPVSAGQSVGILEIVSAALRI